ncbi:hypothetical protein [Streptomyces sp.]|nr:hypothetical protein [Streptomyces sp.]
MPITVGTDVGPAERKVPVGEPAGRVGLAPADPAAPGNGRAEAVEHGCA